MHEELISEEIQPVPGSFETSRMAAGEAALCERFVWRDEEHAVVELLETWKQFSQRFSPGEDRYLRRHWFHIRTDRGVEMKLYFERTGRAGAGRRQRWFVYTIVKTEQAE